MFVSCCNPLGKQGIILLNSLSAKEYYYSTGYQVMCLCGKNNHLSYVHMYTNTQLTKTIAGHKNHLQGYSWKHRHELEIIENQIAL